MSRERHRQARFQRMHDNVAAIKQRNIIEAFAAGAAEAEAAWAADTTVTRLRGWREEDMAFDAACVIAQDCGAVELDDRLDPPLISTEEQEERAERAPE